MGTYQLTLMRGTVTSPETKETSTPETDGRQADSEGTAPTDSDAVVPPESTGAKLMVASRVALPGGRVLLTPIRLENPDEVYTLEFNLNYDPSVLEVVEVQPGSRLSVPASSYDTNTPGVVRFDVTVSDQLEGDGSAAVVDFKVVGAVGASSALTITKTVAMDSSGNARSIEVTEGTSTVETPAAGDGNGDGKITALDALIALRMSAGIAGVDLLMDVTGDGRVTPKDARQLLSMAKRG